MKRRNFLKGTKIFVTNHALKRYLTRSGILTKDDYSKVKNMAKKGDKKSIRFLERERNILKMKFRNSCLSKFLEDGFELRREVAGSKKTRCTFIAYKNGNSLILITTYLQGKRNDHWKNGGRKQWQDSFRQTSHVS